MPELATAWVTLAVSADGMQRDIRKAFREVDAEGAGRRAGQQFSSSAVGATNLTGIERKMAEVGRRGAAALGMALKTAAAAGGTAAAAAVGTSLKLGFDRLRAIDDAKAKLTGLGHSTQSTAKIMDSALDAVKGTAYGLGDAATIAASAVAAGVKPGQELTTYLKRTADAAAIAGTGLSEMGSILNKVRTGQKAYTDDLNMLSDRGVPIYQWIAEEAGVAAGEVQDLAKKGLISSEMFENAITKHIGGAALKMGNSFKGSYENMKAAMGRLGAAAEGPAFDRLRVTFNGVTKAIDEATPKVGEFAASLDARMFDEWIPAAKTAWQQLSEVRDNGAVRSNLVELSGHFSSLTSTVTRLGPPLLAMGQSIGRASAALGVSGWRLFVTALETAAGALNTITPLVEGLARLMTAHQGVVTAAAAGWAAFRTVPAILGRITPATKSAAKALSSFGRDIKGAKGGVSGFFGAYRQSVQWMAQANPTVTGAGRVLFGTGTQAQTASAHMRVLGVNAGAAATGGLRALQSAGTGVIGALGGPFSAALMAAGAAIALTVNQNQKASQSLQAYQDAVRNTGRAQVELNEALMRSRGAFDDGVKSSAVDRIRAIGTELEAASQRTGSVLDRFRAEGEGLFSRRSIFGGFDRTQAEAIKDQADAAGRAKAAIDALKMSQQSLSDVAYGSQAGFDALVTQLEAAGNGGRQAADALRDARRAFLDQQAVAAATAPGVYEMASAMRTLADDTASAADKSNALKTALDGLNPARTKADAQAAHTTAASAAMKQAEVPVDAADGVGTALFEANGAVSTLTVNGVELNNTLKRLVDTTVDVAMNGGHMGAAMSKNDEAFAALARRFQTDVPSIKAAFDTLGGTMANYSGQLSGIAKLFQSGAIPTDHPINVEAPGGQAVLELLKGLGEQAHADNDKTINVDAPMGEATLQLLKKLGYEAKIKDNKLILVRMDGVDEAKRTIEELKKPENKLIRINTLREAFGAAPLEAAPRANGAIVPMADGGFNGLKWILKPQDAGLYAGRGAGTIFAEKETGGEAYIPLASGKRGRSTRILSEVARMFGMELTAREDGGITPEALRQFASGISGRPYKWGAGQGDTFDTDCSGAQSTLANFITGGTGRFGTGDQASALLSRGFQMGDPPKGISAYWVGWRNEGSGGGHTAGTIVDPFNGDVNVEMGGRAGGGQFGGMAAGASMFPQRAWIALASGDDPNGGGGFSASAKVASAANRVTTARQSSAAAKTRLDAAQAELDQLNAQGASAKKLAAAEKKRDKAQESLTKAEQRQAAAEEKLATAKETSGRRGDGTGELGENFGQALASGAMQTLGLDGSLFMNPFDTPNTKSAIAGLNWGGNLLKNIIGGGPGTGPGGGLDLVGGGGLAHGLLGGVAPGPSTVINNHSTVNGDVGVNRPAEHMQRMQLDSLRRNGASFKQF
ncbi:tape measure protein [Mycolicibacter minnesotensis]